MRNKVDKEKETALKSEFNEKELFLSICLVLKLYRRKKLEGKSND